MNVYATPADLARVATGGWSELAERASRDARLCGELLRLSFVAGNRNAYSAEAIALADDALLLLLATLEHTSRATDTYLAPRYQAAMPLDSTMVQSSDLPTAVASIALRRLYGADVPEGIRHGTKWADDYLRDLSTGKASLGLADASVAHVPGRMQVKSAHKTRMDGY